MPSTPMRSDPAVGDTNDTERPPALPGLSGQSSVQPAFPAEPMSGESTRIGPPPDPARISAPKLAAAPPRAAGQPSSSQRLAAAPPARMPSEPKIPVRPMGTMVHAGAPPIGMAGTEPAPFRPQAPSGSTLSLIDPALLTRRCTACNERYPADFLVCPRDATPLTDEAGADVDPLVG